MCSTFSLVAKPCIGGLCSGKSFCTKASMTIAPRKQTLKTFPGISKQGIPYGDLNVGEIVERQCQIRFTVPDDACRMKPEFHPMFLQEAYERCRNICAEYAKSFYLGIVKLHLL